MLLVPHDQRMEIWKDELFLDLLTNNILNKPLNPANILQHALVRLPDLALDACSPASRVPLD